MPEKFVEIIEGELIQMTPADWYHNRVASNIEMVFRRFCSERRGLNFGGDNDGFLLKRNPDTLFSPDASLFKRRPRSKDRPWMEFAPEIVVEVLSPSNHPAELVYKRHTFFEAGTEQFWLVDAEKRQIQFYHRDGRIVTVTGDEVVEGEGIAQGMRIVLEEVFAEL